MNTLHEKLRLITKVWNNDFLESPFLRSQLNPSPEIDTNYYGDIMSYFHDTLDYATTKHFTKNQDLHLFNTIGLLQTLYLHQDLLDELLIIFNQKKSSSPEKKYIRALRNHLIGHPVSRSRYGKLTSTVFLRFDDPKKSITYVLYEKENNFRPKRRIEPLTELIKKHKTYLNTYFDHLIAHIQRLFLLYKERLLSIKTQLNNNADLTEMLENIKTSYPYILKTDRLFNPSSLLRIDSIKETHPRYASAIETFRQELAQSLTERLEAVQKFLAIKPSKIKAPKIEPSKSPKIHIKFVESAEALPVRKDYQYELSKLAERHRMYDAAFFKNLFPDDAAIQEELSNMETHFSDNTEYYASYNYLKGLVAAHVSNNP